MARAGGPPPDSPRPAPPRSQPLAPPASPANPETPATSDTPSDLTPANRAELNTRRRPDRFPLPALRVTPSEGKVPVRLINYTNAIVSFEVIGTTGNRLLGGTVDRPEQSTTRLEGLPLPLNLVVNRSDGRFVLVRPFRNKDGGVDLILDYATELDEDVNYVNITPDGSVYLY
ncbi:MAG: hypothetical protein Fur0042_21000 [Cyanophyceae cyanobacterium]